MVSQKSSTSGTDKASSSRDHFIRKAFKMTFAYLQRSIMFFHAVSYNQHLLGDATEESNLFVDCGSNFRVNCYVTFHKNSHQ